MRIHLPYQQQNLEPPGVGLVAHHGAALHDVDLLFIDLAQRVRRVKLLQ
jgi:hypothetical protein